MTSPISPELMNPKIPAYLREKFEQLDAREHQPLDDTWAKLQAQQDAILAAQQPEQPKPRTSRNQRLQRRIDRYARRTGQPSVDINPDNLTPSGSYIGLSRALGINPKALDVKPARKKSAPLPRNRSFKLMKQSCPNCFNNTLNVRVDNSTYCWACRRNTVPPDDGILRSAPRR